jgi:hypothetical protein
MWGGFPPAQPEQAMTDYEKLGVFYLGASYDLAAGKRGDDLVLYDAKDLTTHAMIIGMTGSGKTGLGLALLEEAAIDKVPIIAVDPKGDLGNLLLTFPNLQPADFAPWVSPQEAASKGVTPEALAESTAAQWRKGLAEWGQSGERISRLRETVELAIYTPGSSAGTPISALRSFTAPPQQVRDDGDLYRERIQATASSVLGLMGIEADPITSREHVLIANILQYAWGQNQSLDVAGLIRAIQQPPFASIGVMDVESFFPSKERFALAMQLNTLLAAPGFDAWMQGEPLDVGRLLFTEAGKPRATVISIAHLGDRERMFFVSLLLNELIGWMRQQPGTGSLRAIFYMDELFGYMPPVANPPSKPPLLTLLKQARAFGLGLVLATQNPVDLDYKGLSNIGTWFIGRLQTERDKARVLEGLEGAAAGGKFDRAEIDRTLSGLGKRVFLMRNVHEDHPQVFTTRWVLSYLAGPLTRDQIRMLAGSRAASTPAPATVAAPAVAIPAPPPSAPKRSGPPVLPAGVAQHALPAKAGTGQIVYLPMVIGAAQADYESTKYDVRETRRFLALCPLGNGPVAVDWDEATLLDLPLDALEASGESDAEYAELPAAAGSAKSYTEWEKLFARWVRTSQPLTLLSSSALKTVAKPNETEREFRIRLQQLGREQRDEQVEALRKKFAPRLNTLEERLARAQQNLAEQQSQAQAQQWNAAASIGGTLLGALMGRKRGISGVGSGIGRIQKEQADVVRAEATVERVRAQLAEAEAELQTETARLAAEYSALDEPLETVSIAPKQADVTVHFIGLAWAPHSRDAEGRLQRAW